MPSITRRLVKARRPPPYKFATPTPRSRRSLRRTPQRNGYSRLMSTTKSYTGLAHRGDVCTRPFPLPAIVPFRCVYPVQLYHGARRLKLRQSRHRKSWPSRPLDSLILILIRYVGYPQGYPQSVHGYGSAPNGVPANPSANSANHAAQAPTRQTARIKIESPSVTAAAKKAAAEAVDVASPEVASSSTSDEDTLACKSKTSKSCSGDMTASPTNSKL